MDNHTEIECNARILQEVAEETGLYQSAVENMVAHYAQFTANTIRSGTLEGVFFPFLGKIQVKPSAQQYKALYHSTTKQMRDLMDIPKMLDHEAL